MPQPTDRVRSTAATRTRWSRRTLLASGAASVGAAAIAGSAVASTPPDGSVAAATGFAAAEDAVAAYLAAMAGADFDAAVAAFAIETYAEQFDFTASLEYLRFYLPYGDSQLLPNTDPFNTAINVAQRRSFVSRLVTNQYLTLVNPAFERDPSGVLLRDEAAIEEFVTSMETEVVSAPLADLSTYQLVTPAEVDAEAAEMLTDDRVVENVDGQLGVLGADEFAELAALATISGRPVALLFRAVRYAESWWLETLQSQLAVLIGIETSTPGVLWLDEAGDDSESARSDPDDTATDPDDTATDPDDTATDPDDTATSSS